MKTNLTAAQMAAQYDRTAARRTAIATMRCTVAKEWGVDAFAPGVRTEALRRLA
jgi:hypothetical protein